MSTSEVTMSEARLSPMSSRLEHPQDAGVWLSWVGHTVSIQCLISVARHSLKPLPENATWVVVP